MHGIVGFVGMPSGGEVILVLLVVLLLFGSKNLPKMARTLGRTLEEFRRAAKEVSDEIIHADDEPEEGPKPLEGVIPKEDPGPSGDAGGEPEATSDKKSEPSS